MKNIGSVAKKSSAMMSKPLISKPPISKVTHDYGKLMPITLQIVVN